MKAIWSNLQHAVVALQQQQKYITYVLQLLLPQLQINELCSVANQLKVQPNTTEKAQVKNEAHNAQRSAQEMKLSCSEKCLKFYLTANAISIVAAFNVAATEAMTIAERKTQKKK